MAKNFAHNFFLEKRNASAKSMFHFFSSKIRKLPALPFAMQKDLCHWSAVVEYQKRQLKYPTIRERKRRAQITGRHHIT